jgi:hypothetical protein
MFRTISSEKGGVPFSLETADVAAVAVGSTCRPAVS